ncbi:MAG: putative RNA polymerase sigma factor [Polyangiales bacterium]|jgi:predicted RNA polymerase sigma factor
MPKYLCMQRSEPKTNEEPEAGLQLLEDFENKKVTESFYWSAALSDLCERAGRRVEAKQHKRVALSAAPSDAIRQLFLRQASLRAG